jgi:hypothetical protein
MLSPRQKEWLEKIANKEYLGTVIDETDVDIAQSILGGRNNIRFWGNNNYKTRQQAGEKAFIKAFEFLEERIKNDKKKS